MEASQDAHWGRQAAARREHLDVSAGAAGDSRQPPMAWEALGLSFSKNKFISTSQCADLHLSLSPSQKGEHLSSH